MKFQGFRRCDGIDEVRHGAATKKSGGNDGIGAIVIAVLGVIAYFIKAILFFLVNLFALLGLPVLLGYKHYAMIKRDRILADPDRQVPDPSEFKWDEGQVQITYLSKLIADDELALEAFNHHGDEKGIRRTDASDGWRFDQRSKLGAQINLALDNIDDRLSTLRGVLHDVRAGVLNTVPSWQECHDDIVSRMAAFEAARIALWIFGGVFVTLLVLPFGWISSLSGFAFSSLGGLKVLFGPASLATVVAAVSIPFWKSKFREKIDPTMHVEYLAEWSRIEYDIRYGDALVPLYFMENEEAQEQEPELQEQQEDPFDNEDGRDWHEVLGVSEDASKSEIKAAWKKRIQKYHPDGVVSLGPVLTAMAEKETVLLNQAYQHAKKVGRA